MAAVKGDETQIATSKLPIGYIALLGAAWLVVGMLLFTLGCWNLYRWRWQMGGHFWSGLFDVGLAWLMFAASFSFLLSGIEDRAKAKDGKPLTS